MSEHLMPEVDTFHRQGVKEIVTELQMEESGLIEALVQMRPVASHALQGRIMMMAGEEEKKEMGQLKPPQPRAMFFRQLALRVALGAAAFLIVVILFLTAVPSARAAFGRFIQQRFGLVLVDPSPQAEPIEETELSEGETLTEVAVATLPLSLEEAQEQVDFPIPLPMLLPQGFELSSARVSTGPGGESLDEDGNRILTGFAAQVILFFKPAESNQSLYHPDAALSLDIFDQTSMEGGYGVPAGSEEPTAVGDNPAIFVKGAWTRVDESPPPTDDNIIWDETADSGMLSWESNGFTFVLHGSHINLTLQDYIRIAESIR